jgi:glycosyltransferase involved in cell wall biosynthesis
MSLGIKHIVFFTPTLNRTGSEVVLLELIKNASLKCRITVITKFRGPMFDEIPAGVEKHALYGKQFGGLGSRIYNRIRKQFVVTGILKKHLGAVWYINTIVLPDILEFAESYNVTTVLHTHELQQMYSALDKKQVERLVRYPKLIIANSEASAAVVRQHGRNGAVEVINPALNPKLVQKNNFDDIRAKLNISKDKFIWVMCGTLDKNKNPFLFIEIAAELKRRGTDFIFVWIGAKADSSQIDEQCRAFAHEFGVTEEVIFTGDVKDKFYDYFAMANGFVLTSQFESFSMATLEAMYLKLPIVVNNCVGVREVLGEGLGYVVEKKNDAAEFADQMLAYMHDPSLVRSEALRARALTFEIRNIAAKWRDVLAGSIL